MISANSEVLVPHSDKVLAEFWSYCMTNERLTQRVSKDYQQIVRKFLKSSNGVISRKTLRDYLSTYLKKALKTYNNQLDGLRAFIQRFLARSVFSLFP